MYSCQCLDGSSRGFFKQPPETTKGVHADEGSRQYSSLAPVLISQAGEEYFKYVLNAWFNYGDRVLMCKYYHWYGIYDNANGCLNSKLR